MLMRRVGLLLFLGLGLTAVRAPAQTNAALQGQLAYVRGGMACIAPAAGGRELILPESKGADSVFLSPTGDMVLYFARRTDEKPLGRYAAITRGYLSRAPFTRSEPLPAPLDRAAVPKVMWSASGDRAFIRAERIGKGDGDGTFVERDGKSFSLHKFQGVYRPGSGAFLTERYPVESLSRDGRMTAWSRDYDRIEFRGADGGAATTLFSSDRPTPMLTALRQARSPERIRAVLNISDRDRKTGESWRVGPPALLPDGKRLFFAANAGAPVGASGNTDYCFFAADLQTRKLAVLSRLGQFESSQLPQVCRVSPDGERLLIHITAHGSFIDSISTVYVVDLINQGSRELIGKDPVHKGDTNLVSGEPVWSPDSRHVAVAVHYYAVSTGPNGRYQVRPWVPGRGRGKAVEADTWVDRKDDYEVLIFDASTGRRVRTLAGAVKPTWSR